MEIGRTLREARLRQGVDISDIEAQTKIRAKFLRALENEEWALVGNDTYVKVFLRTYAENLHLDPVPLIEEYVISSVPGGGQVRPKPLVLSSNQATNSRLRNGLVAAGIVIVLGVAILLIGQGS